jgi:hypothetical protein
MSSCLKSLKHLKANKSGISGVMVNMLTLSVVTKGSSLDRVQPKTIK